MIKISRINHKIKDKYKGEILFISSSFLTPTIAFISNVIATAYIIPSEMGVYQSIILIGTYVSFLHLGVFNGLNRNIAFYKAQNRNDIVQEQVNTAHSVAQIISLVGLLIGAFYMIYIGYLGKGHVYLLTSLLLIFNLVISPHITQIETTYRSGQDFKALGFILYKENLLYFLTSLLPIFIGFIGKIISDSTRLIFGFWLRWKERPIKATDKGTIESGKELIQTGFPLLLGGYLWSIFVIADQSLIALKFSIEDLGIYTLSRLIIIALMFIPTALNAILYPKAANLYGRTGEAFALRSFWIKSLLLFILIIIPLIISAYFLLPIIVNRFMPDYILGLPSAKINLFTGLTFVSMGPSVILATLKKNNLYIFTLIFALSIFWGISYLFPGRFSTLESVAWFKLFLSSLLSIFILSYTYYLTKKND